MEVGGAVAVSVGLGVLVAEGRAVTVDVAEETVVPVAVSVLVGVAVEGTGAVTTTMVKAVGVFVTVGLAGAGEAAGAGDPSLAGETVERTDAIGDGLSTSLGVAGSVGTGDPVGTIGLAITGLAISDADGVAGVVVGAGSVELGDAARVWIAGGTMSPGLGVMSAFSAACCVALRSSTTWVSTLGATVMTGSLGCELLRDRMKARNKLAAKVPSAIRALERFKRTSRFSTPVWTVSGRTGSANHLAYPAFVSRSYEFYALWRQICSQNSLASLTM